MQKRIHVVLMTLLTMGIASAEPPAGSSPPVPILDEVLVSGEQPGPGMWKVAKGDHTLWVLGSYAPVPKKMTWRSKEAEAVLANSQAMLTGPSAKADIGFFKGIALLPSLIGVRNNPDGKKLKEVLPPDLYARWLGLKQKYIGDDNGVEKQRPIFAALELLSKAIDKSGLTNDSGVMSAIEKLAKKNKLQIITPTISLDIDKPRAAIKEFKKSPLDDVECFSKSMQWLESDLGMLRSRANAWAVGDVKLLRDMARVDARTACIEAAMNMQVVQEKGLQDVPQRMADAWVSAAKQALEKNKSTFAVLSVEEIMKPDGYVAKLVAQGYALEEP